MTWHLIVSSSYTRLSTLKDRCTFQLDIFDFCFQRFTQWERRAQERCQEMFRV